MCVWIFVKICSICFEGINKLAYNFISSNNYQYLGIIYTDFAGDDLIKKTIGLNSGKFVPCPPLLISKGCTYCSSTAQCLGCN